MPQNLFAACRINGALVAKRIRLDQAVQQQIENIFHQQEAEFRDGITSEVQFDGSWTPDDDEFLTIDVPQEAAIFADTLMPIRWLFQTSTQPILKPRASRGYSQGSSSMAPSKCWCSDSHPSKF